MCGIFGFLGTSAAAAGVDVAAVLESLQHRGPDDRGTFVETLPEIAGKPEQTCVLAHTRLSIVDLSAGGHQPMSTRDGRWRLIFNGEIYNHLEIRADLHQAGERFIGSSDTEVVLYALVRWGAQAVKRFTGMFALALWDREERALLLVRDRLGEKPLYFAPLGNDLAFASELRTLLASGLVGRVASRTGLLSYLESGSVAEPWTLIRNVWAFPPATVLRAQNGRVTAERFWDSPFYDRPSQSLKQAAPQVRARLEAAVRNQMIADVPVGLFLSAGMDSTAIAAMAQMASGSGVRSFTVSLENKDLDEGAVAARVALQMGCEHHDVRVPALEALSQVPAAVAALDQPSIDGVNTYIVSKAVRESGTVVALSGVGGDEIFAGYSTFRTVGQWAKLNTLVRSIGAGPFTRWAARSSLPLSVPLRKALGLAGANPASGEFHRSLRMLFSSGQVQRLSQGVFDETHDGEVCPPWLDTGRGPRIEPFGAVGALSQMELDGYLRNTLLRDSDAMSMAHGLEVRAPFLDHHLIALAASVHGRDKIEGEQNKPLLAAAIPELPHFVSRRRKTGFGLPFDFWLRGPLRSWAAGHVDDGGDGLSRVEKQSIWASFLQGSRTVSWSRAWALIVLASWLRRYEVTLA
jgi:asparagine synthase (glutamine-hydrolysing)